LNNRKVVDAWRALVNLGHDIPSEITLLMRRPTMSPRVCHATAEHRGLVVDPRCVQKTGDELLACLAKAKTALPCLTLGDASALAGTSHRTPCMLQSECPDGACGTVGEPTRTSACLDDTATPGLDCVDTAPFDGERECVNGPLSNQCSAASGHPQRSCANDGDCGGGVGTCQSTNRSCFLTGSAPGFGRVGTGTLAADGVVDSPINGVSHPVLAAVGCTGATGFAPLNIVSGFPGPVRLTERVTATVLP
jgi:hypothetical protein